MNAPKNRRRAAPAKRRRKSPAASRAGTAITALVLGCLSALGLWRCLDGGDPLAMIPDAGPARVASVAPQPRPIDVGQGLQPDPTLVNEQVLLASEEPPEQPAGEDGPVEEPAATPQSTDTDEARLLAKYPMHAVAFHFHTQVFAEPDPVARVVGYARRGSTSGSANGSARPAAPAGGTSFAAAATSATAWASTSAASR